MDYDFRNLEEKLLEEEKRKVERKKVMEDAMDQDKNGESEKERIEKGSDDDLDPVQMCIKQNKKLMEEQEAPDFKDRILSTIANQYDLENPKAGWF